MQRPGRVLHRGTCRGNTKTALTLQRGHTGRRDTGGEVADFTAPPGTTEPTAGPVLLQPQVPAPHMGPLLYTRPSRLHPT